MIKSLPWAALTLGIVFLILFSACGAAADVPGQAPADETTPSVALTRDPADERAKGELNAPVTLIEYGDYQ